MSLLLQRGHDCHVKVGDQGRGVTVLLLHIKHSGITSKLQVGVLGAAKCVVRASRPYMWVGSHWESAHTPLGLVLG